MDAAAARLRTDERFTAHRGPITCVAGIPNSHYAVTSGYDSAVGLVDLEAGSMELLGYHTHLANRVVVDPQGRRAASCSSDYTICLWDLETRQAIRVLRGHRDDVEDFAFVGDDTGVSAARDHRVIIWDLNTGAIRRILERHEKDVLSVEVSDGKIYSSGDDMTLRQWDLASGEQLHVWGPFEQETDTCAYDPRRRRVILGADDGCMYVFEHNGTQPTVIPAHGAGIKKVAVSPATGDILSAAYDQRLRIWSAESLTARLELERHPATWERSLNWSPDGRRILAGTFDGTVLVWDAESGARVCEIGAQGTRGNACLNDIAVTPSGELVTVSDDGVIRTGHLTPEESRWTGDYQPRTGRVLMNAVTAGDQPAVVAAGAHDHKLHLFERRGGELVAEREIQLGLGPINCVHVAHNPGNEGEYFVGCYNPVVVRLSPTGEMLGEIRVHEGAIKSLRLHPQRPLGVSCGADGLLRSWTFDGELVADFRGHMGIINDIGLDPDGRLVASAGRDFTVKVYDLESGHLLHSLATGRQSPKSLCFWDHNTVMIGNYWGYLLRFDLAEERVARVRISDNGISSMSRAGDYLAAVSYNGIVNLVHPGTLEVVNTLRAMTQKMAIPPVTM